MVGTHTIGEQMNTRTQDLSVSPRRVKLLATTAFVGAIGFFTLMGSFYTVPQTDLAYVQQFGKVVNPSAGPVGAGLHFKMPFIQGVDKLRITRDTDTLGDVVALTRDTQSITLEASVTTSVPPSAVYHLLYEVGKSGNVDLNKNYNATIITEIRNVIGKHNIAEIAGEERAQVLSEIQIAASQELARLYGTNIDQVQISVKLMPETYVQRINQAMLSQAAILQSERDRTKAGIDAETAKITAAGLANKSIEEARGRADSLLLEQKAKATGIEQVGAAEAHAKELMADALKTNPVLVQYEQATRWNGAYPQYMMGGNSVLPLMNIPQQH